jgi:hypothetical protein
MTTKAAILQAIRHKCLDCCVYQPAEVRECPVSTCGLWPFRFAVDPEPSQSRGFAKSRVYTGDPGQAAPLAEPAGQSTAPGVCDG